MKRKILLKQRKKQKERLKKRQRERLKKKEREEKRSGRNFWNLEERGKKRRQDF